MSKPKPFISSLGGIIFLLVIAIALLWANNYRSHRAGFNLPFESVAVVPVDRKQADTFHLVTSADTFAKLSQPTQPVSINWDKQLAFIYFAPIQTTGAKVQPLTVHRDGAVINITYQLASDDPSGARGNSYPGAAIVVDRTKLISSSNLTINLIQGQTVIQTLTVSPNQI